MKNSKSAIATTQRSRINKQGKQPTHLQLQREVGKYEILLNQVHPGFWKKLLRQAPDLTPTEIRICALTRLHLGSKQMAEVLSLAPSSIDSHRSRAREKLHINRGQNLESILHAV